MKCKVIFKDGSIANLNNVLRIDTEEETEEKDETERGIISGASETD